MEGEIKARVEQLITDYIVACGGALNCWLIHDGGSAKWRTTKLLRVAIREPNFDLSFASADTWLERVSVNLVRALLMKCRQCVDRDGQTLITHSSVTIGREFVELHVFMSGWRDDEQLAKEIEDAYRSRGNRFEPFDSRPRLSVEGAAK